MSGVTYFYESCPVCGRHLRIPVQHYGRLMECTHCGGEFLAGQPVPEEPARPAATVPVLPATALGQPPCDVARQ
jgi:rRNA maturation protein Nop10